MTGKRFSNSVLCFAASVMLCGVPALAQDPMGMPGNQTTPGAAGSGMPGRSPGGMQGSSATGMQDNSNMGGSSNKASSQDKTFMKKAMEGDMAEIQLAQLAQQKASSDQVKQFAQRMIDDHAKLSSQMKPLAQQLGVEPPTDLSAKHKALQTKLQGLSGAQFDQEYVKAMVADHREDDQAFLQEASTTRNPMLKTTVNQGEPIIAEHLKMAKDLEKSTKGKASM